MPVHLVWYKRDLRVHDHAPLREAAARGAVLPLYVAEPAYWALPDTSGRQWAAVADGLRELRDDLAALGQPLVVRAGDVVEVLAALHARHGLAALWSHEETGNAWTFARDRRVAAWAGLNPSSNRPAASITSTKSSGMPTWLATSSIAPAGDKFRTRQSMPAARLNVMLPALSVPTLTVVTDETADARESDEQLVHMRGELAAESSARPSGIARAAVSIVLRLAHFEPREELLDLGCAHWANVPSPCTRRTPHGQAHAR